MLILETDATVHLTLDEVRCIGISASKPHLVPFGYSCNSLRPRRDAASHAILGVAAWTLIIFALYNTSYDKRLGPRQFLYLCINSFLALVLPSQMISAVFFFSPKGDVLMSRFYKNDVRRNVHDVFRIQVINSAIKLAGTQDSRLPILTIGSTSFISIRSGLLWLVAVARSNQDCLVILEFLYALLHLLQDLFVQGNGPLTEQVITGNFVNIFEVLGEVLEFGYPINMEPSFLSTIIPGLADYNAKSPEKRDSDLKRKFLGEKKAQTLAIYQAYDPSKVSWRNHGIKYRRNEIFLNVDEKVNVLLDRSGELLRSHIDGTISMKCQLSGMPTCQFGFSCNGIDEELQKSLTLDDFKFHKCVDLAKYDSQQIIAFVPPDGSFQLMSYNIAEAYCLPFSIVPLVTTGAERVSLRFRLSSNYSAESIASSVILKVFVSADMNKHTIKCSQGRAKFNPSESAIVWKFTNFYGGQSHDLSLDFEVPSGYTGPFKPRIALDFTLDTHTASGLQVKFLRVSERSNYRTVKWVKYCTQAGSYELRL